MVWLKVGVKVVEVEAAGKREGNVVFWGLREDEEGGLSLCVMEVDEDLKTGERGSEVGGVGSFDMLLVVGCRAFALLVGCLGSSGSCRGGSSELKAAKLRLREVYVIMVDA